MASYSEQKRPTMKVAGRFHIPMRAKSYEAPANAGGALCFNPSPPTCGGEPTRSVPHAESNGPNSLTLC